jgi:hypothetical protein
MPPPEPSARDTSLQRRSGGNMVDDMAPLIPNQRQLRPGDVSSSVPEYVRPNDREYPIPTRKKSGPTESGGFDYYVGYAPEHEQPLPYVEYFIPSPSMFAICYNGMLKFHLYMFCAFAFALLCLFHA